MQLQAIGYIQGLGLVGILSIIALILSHLSFIQVYHLSPLIIAVFLGGCLFLFYRNYQPQFEKGVTFSAKKLLRLGIILYGFNISFSEVASVGAFGILTAIIVVICILALGILIGHYLGLDREMAILVSGGSAICGAAAVLALESSLRSEPSKGIVAVGSVVIFGLLSMLLYPLAYALDLIPLNESQMGVYIGATLHEVANVVGAGSAISQETQSVAILIKMIRVILLVPVLFIIPYLFSLQKDNKKTLFIPYFAFLFLLAIICNSLVSIPTELKQTLQFLATFFLTMAMVALGLQIDLKKFIAMGKKAFLLAFCLWIILIVGGLLWVLWLY
ncbi:hypothetical protein CCZ01_08570 [Helicobacter monodelphidis]|uniref:YeiH family protein n=1 Tax=Helicobacter sp. 15-1451 TaxID=2004995 RepID=UPI000DCDB6A7|nr:YeiH family protein [Helicobacter sp. 15-1451]RAX56750.1 hypothetical protein CCZ01_08570 [Helicobacter sp. 15-1451]